MASTVPLPLPRAVHARLDAACCREETCTSETNVEAQAQRTQHTGRPPGQHQKCDLLRGALANFGAAQILQRLHARAHAHEKRAFNTHRLEPSLRAEQTHESAHTLATSARDPLAQLRARGPRGSTEVSWGFRSVARRTRRTNAAEPATVNLDTCDLRARARFPWRQHLLPLPNPSMVGESKLCAHMGGLMDYRPRKSLACEKRAGAHLLWPECLLNAFTIPMEKRGQVSCQLSPSVTGSLHYIVPGVWKRLR